LKLLGVAKLTWRSVEYKQKVDAYKLDTYKHELYLVFASPYMTDAAVNHIKTNADAWKTDGIHVAFMRLNGNRYNIAWASTNFTEMTFVDTDTLVIKGGGKVKRSRRKASK
jgi:hypothetical protein